MELVLSRQRHSTSLSPSEVLGLPVEEVKHFENNAAVPSDSDDADNAPMANFPDSIGDEEAESVEENKPHDTFPVVSSVPCGC
eukprot:9446190-Karenia_brevis.AAC.1